MQFHSILSSWTIWACWPKNATAQQSASVQLPLHKCSLGKSCRHTKFEVCPGGIISSYLKQEAQTTDRSPKIHNPPNSTNNVQTCSNHFQSFKKYHPFWTYPTHLDGYVQKNQTFSAPLSSTPRVSPSSAVSAPPLQGNSQRSEKSLNSIQNDENIKLHYTLTYLDIVLFWSLHLLLWPPIRFAATSPICEKLGFQPFSSPVYSNTIRVFSQDLWFRYEKEKVGKHNGCQRHCKSGRILESCEIKELNISHCAWPSASSRHRLPQPLRCPEMFIRKASVQFCSAEPCLFLQRPFQRLSKGAELSHRTWSFQRPNRLKMAHGRMWSIAFQPFSTIYQTYIDLPCFEICFRHLWKRFNVASTPPTVHQVAAGSLGPDRQDPHPTQRCIQGSQLTRALGGRAIRVWNSMY